MELTIITRKFGIINIKVRGRNMLKTILFVLAIIIFCSCNNYKTIPESKELIFYEITNEDLVHEIEMYIGSVDVHNNEEKIMNVYVIQLNDTTIYELSYATSAFGLIVNPLTIFAKVKENIVAFSYHNAKGIKMPDSLAWKYLKDYFPKEYEYYQKNNDYPPPTTGGGIEWRLTFKDGKLIDKEEMMTQ